MKYLALLWVAVVSLPFWLPEGVGGDVSYHHILTESMKGTLDPGSFVVLRREGAYQIGDVVGFRQEGDGRADGPVFIHRIIGQLPDGRFLIKGDAISVVEEVEQGAITGRLVFAVPGIGLLFGGIRSAPLLFGLLLALVSFKDRLARVRMDWMARGRSLFLPSAALVFLAFVLDLGGAGRVPGQINLLLALLGLLIAARFVEVALLGSRWSRLAGGMYGLVAGLSIVLLARTAPSVLAGLRL